MGTKWQKRVKVKGDHDSLSQFQDSWKIWNQILLAYTCKLYRATRVFELEGPDSWCIDQIIVLWQKVTKKTKHCDLNYFKEDFYHPTRREVSNMSEYTKHIHSHCGKLLVFIIRKYKILITLLCWFRMLFKWSQIGAMLGSSN